MMKPLIFISVCSLAVISCEKTISFQLEDTTPKMVVEATIENDQSPVVILSKSLNYFSGISPDLLANSFVHHAEIDISNGALTHRLKEYAIPLANGYSVYYYSLDSASPATMFTGQLNTAYTLKIVADGKEYLSSTTIPGITKQIDSLFWKPAPGNSDPNKVVLMVRATDRPGFGDYIRYFTKRNSERFYPAVNSVFDDNIIDGTTYEVEVERGVDRNNGLPEGFTFFDRGDTVVFKLCNIDKATFEFWRTMEYSYASIGNPFSSPTRVLGNISNGALGYFGGYAAQFRTLIIPQ